MEEAAAHRVRRLADDALARAEAARGDLEALLVAVERLRAELAPPRTEANGHPAPMGVDAARLVAIEMAVAGRSREEVERHLRAAYRGPDTEGVLADVFGEL